MKKYLLYFSIISLVFFAWCWEDNQQQTLTWDVVTWWWAMDALIQEYREDMDEKPVEQTVEQTENKEVSENKVTTENTWNVEEKAVENAENSTNENVSEVSSWENIENISWTEAPKPVRESWFWIEECDRIINFDLCVISKAPIENQETMKISLQKAVEPWKILANAQLREVCLKTIEKTTFKEVVNHYEALEDWCKY